MKLVVPIILMVVFIMICVFGRNSYKRDDCVVVESESFYSDYSIENDQVSIRCVLVINNSFGISKSVYLSADFPDDVGKLITDKTLYSKDANGNIILYQLPANSKESYSVSFIGDYAGVNIKHDRLLPKTQVIIQNDTGGG